MSQHDWLAIDAGTAPMVRAHELRFAWERFLDGDEDDTANVREAITDSWRRSQSAGVDPTGARLAPVVADEDETHDRWAGHPLGEAAPLIHDCLSAIADEQGYLIVVSDAAGLLMSIEGSANVRLRAAADMNFAEGTLWSEPGAGTNAIGTALAVDHAVQVFGPEHFSEPGAALDVQRGADPRPGHRRAARDHRPDRRPEHRPPPHPRRGHRHRPGRRGQPAPRPPGARRPPARPLRRPRHAGPGRARHAVRAPDHRPAAAAGAWPDGWSSRPAAARSRCPAARPRWPSRSSQALEAFVVRATEARPAPARPAAAPPPAARPRPPDPQWTPRLRPRLAEILALLSAAPHGLTRRRRCAPSCTATAAASPACASRSAGCAS